MVDFHTHSTFSDGVKTPTELAGQAAAAGIAAIALTDHDTTDGTAEFLKACSEHRGLTGVAGVEFSAESDRGSLHMLGLGVDASNPALCEMLTRIRDSRDERNRRILSALNSLGYSLTWEEVEETAGGDVMGRPHFAQAMIRRGWAESISEVFERFLSRGAPAYVSRFHPSPEEVIALVKGAGGVVSVAHPVSWSMDEEFLREKFKTFAALGLDAIECYHPRVGNKARAMLLRLAGELGLLVSAGSDYHGIESDDRLGAPDKPPEGLAEPLLARMSPYGISRGN